MDKVRAFMRVIWTQRFWVLSVVGPVVAVVCWMLASGKLEAAFKSNKNEIEGHFNAMNSISTEQVHGNADVNANETREAVKISASVRSLWKRLYDKQRESVLVWPEALDPSFITYIERRKFGDPIPQNLRTMYLNYAKKQFDELVKMVRAQNLTVTDAAFNGGRVGEGTAFVPGTDIEVRTHLVDWLDQGNLRTKLEFPTTPSAMHIWVTQEDLWVYETLLTAIDKTNTERGATPAADNAAVKVITTLEVGAPAAAALTKPGNIIMPAAAEGGGESGLGPPMGADGLGPPEGVDAADPAAMDAFLLAGRYIGDDGAPIADGAGTGVEFRRLPVNMVLTMDQRFIPTLLVECANATLPIEVQRLRINPEKSGVGFESATAGPGFMPGAGGSVGPPGRSEGVGRPGPSMGIGRPGPSRGIGAPGQGMGMATVDLEGLASEYATVEIQGLVYIYNQPSDTELTVPGEELAAAETETTPPADEADAAPDEEEAAPTEEEPAPADDGSVAVAEPAVVQ